MLFAWMQLRIFWLFLVKLQFFWVNASTQGFLPRSNKSHYPCPTNFASWNNAVSAYLVERARGMDFPTGIIIFYTYFTECTEPNQIKKINKTITFSSSGWWNLTPSFWRLSFFRSRTNGKIKGFALCCRKWGAASHPMRTASASFGAMTWCSEG